MSRHLLCVCGRFGSLRFPWGWDVCGTEVLLFIITYREHMSRPFSIKTHSTGPRSAVSWPVRQPRRPGVFRELAANRLLRHTHERGARHTDDIGIQLSDRSDVSFDPSPTMVTAAVEGTCAPQDGLKPLQLQWHRSLDRPFSVTVRRPYAKPSARALASLDKLSSSSIVPVFSSAPATSSAWRPTSSATLDYNGASRHRTADQPKPCDHRSTLSSDEVPTVSRKFIAISKMFVFTFKNQNATQDKVKCLKCIYAHQEIFTNV